MKRSLLVLFTWLLCLQVRAGSAADIAGWFTPHGNGTFSKAAHNVCTETRHGSDGDIWSPNHARKIVVRPSSEGDTQLFAVDEAGKEFAIATEGWPCPEVGWSATSTLFFVTYSDGGAVGTYRTSAYRISSGSLEKLDLTGAVRRDFQRRYPKCFSFEEPNIAGITWSVDSTKLLVAAEVLPHSNCDNMGTFNLYAVAVSNGRITNRMSQVDAKLSFHGVLGQELRNAEDSCFSQAGSCWIPALHQTRKK